MFTMNLGHTHSPHDLSPSYSWIYFLLFLVSFSLLSYGGLSLENQLLIGLFGLILPFGMGITLSLQNRQKSVSTKILFQESLPAPPWLIILFLVIFIFIRFYRLTTVPYWPLSD